MVKEKDDFSGLTPVNTPVDSYEIRMMEICFYVVPARLEKIKRLVSSLYKKGGDNV